VKNAESSAGVGDVVSLIVVQRSCVPAISFALVCFEPQQCIANRWIDWWDSCLKKHISDKARPVPIALGVRVVGSSIATLIRSQARQCPATVLVLLGPESRNGFPRSPAVISPSSLVEAQRSIAA